MSPIPSRRLALVCLSLVAATACMTGPHNGTTTGDPVIGETFRFEGYYPEPNIPISLQVMNNPGLDPTLDSNWTQFATATTVTTPTSFNSTDPLFHWSVTAAPVPHIGFSLRWSTGGLVKVRAVAKDPDGDTTLYTFDDITYPDCFAANVNEPWNVLGTECQGVGLNRSALVSTRNSPVDAAPGARTVFLGKKQSNLPSAAAEEAETLQYYAQIQAPATLAAFRTKFGFPNSEVTATYYNDGDLGIGREMHCRSFPVPSQPNGVACYVSNYAEQLNGVPVFGGSSAIALADAVSRTNEFATVAMVFTPPANTANSVQFMVYDAQGALAPKAQLDNAADNTFVPGNCLTCHGIRATYNPVNNSVSGQAKFLPFDVFSFRYSNAPGFTYAEQANALRSLNDLITRTSPTAAITDFITGMYAPKAVSDVTAMANDTYVPPQWKQTKQKGLALYNGVVKPYCRTCHMSAGDGSAFLDQAVFEAYAPIIKTEVCGSGTTRTMPQAEHVMRKFWKSGARAYLDLGLDLQSHCRP
ncbi:hypothetical protein OWM54_33225 [Myxococcus sp. MISCRS1]|uniref:hypothetical protein n=1 Tax=Myxococcus TaxID=32 RepID=UPI001CBC8FF7|nr:MULTISPECIES: hypothetical protein [unclassified Myxococcus]MBZ4395049.1 hypothetical protein [Myxococcus sp. AS-1-15]MBZ4406833.1 hypothetical protein [Myxococcus sp. XM-1-1-1]MCY1002028.1 hypothetical protein [Myxococcus sp. MISCRS1]BDT36404.1 hypothetical protein MFMH1_60730 [Myxococcus sp. MH1]